MAVEQEIADPCIDMLIFVDIDCILDITLIPSVFLTFDACFLFHLFFILVVSIVGFCIAFHVGFCVDFRIGSCG